MLPFAPALFSTTTVWPSFSPSAWATVRAIWSVAPPGAKGTITRRGRSGKDGLSWAATPVAARAVKPAASSAAAAARIDRMENDWAAGFIAVTGTCLRSRVDGPCEASSRAWRLSAGWPSPHGTAVHWTDVGGAIAFNQGSMDYTTLGRTGLRVSVAAMNRGWT